MYDEKIHADLIFYFDNSREISVSWALNDANNKSFWQKKEFIARLHMINKSSLDHKKAQASSV